MEDGLQFKFAKGILIAPSTSKKQLPFCRKSFRPMWLTWSLENTPFLANSIMEKGTMAPLGFGMLFGNKDKANWLHFWWFIRKTQPTIDQPEKTILMDQDKGSLSALEEVISTAGLLNCSFHRRQNITKGCSGGDGHTLLTAIWLYNLLCGCKSLVSLRATRCRYEDQMHPTDCQYLFAIPEEMKFPATRCAQGEFVYMYNKLASSGVESMIKANKQIFQRMVVDILNAVLILLKKESSRSEKSRFNAWKLHSHSLQRGS
jgi:hypothetical protein